MKLMNVIFMLIFAIVGISAMGPVRARRSYSEAQERNGLYNIEYDGVPEALPPRRVRFYRTGGTILLG
ncbi:hypothetical protein ANCCAN_21099 [Ancylostoma caninum]|uniref:Uncharacterized protein n=1 Tax=Ancylostoma caninum TaxID=29170 RepID=A0A368FNI7_ANCCA|nr:hypothetical protein ANCCAN_21099 [Ancylostoma caninum]